MGLRRDKITTILWGPPPATHEERKLLVKLDVTILSYICLSYFINYIDRSNFANAYVTGMMEQVGFTGNQFTLANSCFTAGYIVGQWPSAVILASGRVRPRFWFPFCCAAWGFCTLGMAFVTTPHQVMAIRFVQAIFEASTFAGSHYILGSWYRDDELGKRTAVFTSAAQFGTFFSGVMQGGIKSTLDGRHGKAGWQWLFIINFAMTLPIAIYGFLMFPDTPHTSRAFWLTPEERDMCRARIPSTHSEYVITWRRFASSVRAAATTWRFYLFCALFMFSATAFEKTGVYSEYLFWMKSVKLPDGKNKYTPSEINYYPTIQTAVAIVGTYAMTVYCDYTSRRFIANVIMFASVLLSSILLLVWDIGIAGHHFAYAVSGIGYAGQASNFAWANTLTRDDDMLRSLTLFSMNLASNIWALWYGIAIWPVKDAPRFKKGQIGTIVTGFVSVLVAGAIAWCSRRWPVGTTEAVEGGPHVGEGDVEGGATKHSEAYAGRVASEDEKDSNMAKVVEARGSA